MRTIRIGGESFAGFSVVFYGKGVGVGRAVLQSVNGAIPAGFFRFKPDEPENEANLARSVFVQLKHAQNKFCGLRRRFRRALEKGQCTGDRNDVSRETIAVSDD